MMASFTNVITHKPFRSAALAGVILTLALPPLSLFPFLFLSLFIFYRVLNKASSAYQAGMIGFLFGLGYFVSGFYWINYALFVDIQRWWWVLPLSLLALPSLFAFYYALGCYLLHRLAFKPLAKIFAFALILSLCEILRGYLFTGFPWNLLGYVWADYLAVMQITSWVGIYGLTLLTILWGLIFVFYHQARALSFVVALSFLVTLVFGAIRLSKADESTTDIYLRLVQPSIPQSAKWDNKRELDNLNQLIKLSNESSTQKLYAVIWPESALTFDLDKTLGLKDLLKNTLKADLLLTGTIRTQGEDYYNSMVAYQPQKAETIAYFDKAHLVPFGEYIPFQNLLKFSPVAVDLANISGFSKGDGLQSLMIADLPTVSPLICYEVIFPAAVTHHDIRPDWLLNLTNDGWYGKTAGPHQHLAIAKTRAIEEGLPLVRAANNGISAVISPYGHTLKALHYNEIGVIDFHLPAPLKPTFFSKYAHFPLIMMLLGLMLVVLILQRKSN
jgi:apolipoprotein N-acyltransferase